MTLPSAAALPLPCIATFWPALNDGVGNETSAIGRCASSMANGVFAIPAPHVRPSLVQMHWPPAVVLGQSGGCGETSSDVCGNAIALALMRSLIFAGLKLPFTDAISAAMPDTIGAEKLVPTLLVRYWFAPMLQPG